YTDKEIVVFILLNRANQGEPPLVWNTTKPLTRAQHRIGAGVAVRIADNCRIRPLPARCEMIFRSGNKFYLGSIPFFACQDSLCGALANFHIFLNVMDFAALPDG